MRNVEVSLVERERLDEFRERVENFANALRLAPIHVEPRGHDDELRTFSQRDKSRHRRTNPECACFVGGRRQHAATVPRAAHANWFSAQFRAVAHLDRRVKAIHVEVNDFAVVKHPGIQR